MACACNSPKKRHVARTPLNVTPRSNSTRVVAKPATQGGTQTHCGTCGWLLKRSRYIDVSTHTIVERMSCTNGNCSTNKRK